MNEKSMVDDKSIPKSPVTKNLQILTLVGYFGLLALMPVWYIWLYPNPEISVWLSLSMFWIPLMFPFKGLMSGKPYTYAWANFVVMLYFLHSLTGLWITPEERHLYVLELIFSIAMFIGGTYYARFRGRELGLKLPKLKDLN